MSEIIKTSLKNNRTKGLKKILLGLILFFLDYAILLAGEMLVFKVFGFKECYRNVFSLKGNFYLESLIPFLLIFSAYFIRNLYSFKPHLFWEELRHVTNSIFIGAFINIGLLLIIGKIENEISLLMVLLVFYVLDLIARYLYRILMFKLNLLRTNTIIIGSGFQGYEFAKLARKHHFSTYNIIGFVDEAEDMVHGEEVLGKLINIYEVIERYEIDEVVIAIPRIARKELCDVIKILENKVDSIKFIPDMYGLMTFSNEINDYEKILTITSSQGLLRWDKRILKRTFDIIVGSIGLFIFFMLYVVLGVFIKFEDGGKILYRQNRIGKNVKEFQIFKFRSMFKDADKRLEKMLEEVAAVREEYYSTFKLKNDPRITKIGKFIRKTSLDEFPQFLNVIKGDMSIVGPRPVVQKEIDMYYKNDADRVFCVKPGITGMWQANGRSDVEDYEERIAMDIYYIRNWSLWFDIIILLKTVFSVIKREGAV